MTMQNNNEKQNRTHNISFRVSQHKYWRRRQDLN